MPRARTGTLVPPLADGIWRARVTKTHADGSKSRPLYSLGTTDKSLARRKLARLVAIVEAGADVDDAAERVSTPERVRDYADAWIKAREVRGVLSVRDERMWLARYALDALGSLPLGDVRPSHVRGVLDDAAGKGLRRESVSKIRGVLHRLFGAAWREETIERTRSRGLRYPPAARCERSGAF